MQCRVVDITLPTETGKGDRQIYSCNTNPSPDVIPSCDPISPRRGRYVRQVKHSEVGHAWGEAIETRSTILKLVVHSGLGVRMVSARRTFGNLCNLIRSFKRLLSWFNVIVRLGPKIIHGVVAAYLRGREVAAVLESSFHVQFRSQLGNHLLASF